MKIIVDAFGGDNAPIEIIKGCEMAVQEFGCKIILVGKESVIKTTADKNNISLDNIIVHNAESVISMDDEPTCVLKEKNDSSMAVGLKLLVENTGDAFVSAGNSGALAVGSTLIVKRIRGIKRCAFAPIIPHDNGNFMLIDSGANVDCRPEMLKQFGIMGSIYMQKIMNVKNPKVGLANIGIEKHKGDSLRQETYKILNESKLNFVGNIEAKEIPQGVADVIVADGFTGNIILKLYEGLAEVFFNKIKSVFLKNFKTKLAGIFIKPELKKMFNQLNHNEHGGAPFLGASKPVFKAHGTATAKTIKNAIKQTEIYVKNKVTEIISESLEFPVD